MEPILGIDLGTTNSEVAVWRNGKADVLREDGEAILPSVVGLDADGRLLVGVAARNQWVLAPERTVRSIKRKMGEDTAVRLGDRDYSPQEISAMILRTLKQRAEKELGCEVRKAVITVPAFFNEVQREATRAAGEMAGLEVVRIINEPTAASLTYDPHPDRMERLAVYDLGGGTFDVSIVEIESGVVEVLASHGDTRLGGDDFDQLLLDHVAERFKDRHGIDLRNAPAARSRALRAVEEAKRTLSVEPVARIQEEFIAEKRGAALHLDIEIDRNQYEELIEPLVVKTLVKVDEALSDARLTARQIDKVILVGGASRTPMIHRLLEERLGQPVHFEVDPDLCVAMGAAVQAAMIGGEEVGPVLVDITPHTLGIQALSDRYGHTTHHAFIPIIERNTPLPASRAEMFGTAADDQEAAKIAVFQGEHDDVRHNEPVGEFLLEGLASVDRGNQILVRFDLDLDGILKVTAVERSTGLQKRLVIDNAVSRLRASNLAGDAARAAAGSGAGKSQAPSAAVDDSLPAEWRAVMSKSLAVVASAERIAPQAGEEDRREIEQLLTRLQQATAERSAAEAHAVLAQLEDLVFYLQDA